MSVLKSVAAAIVAIAAALPAGAETYRFATNVSADSTAGQMIGQFVDAVTEKTEGRVEFELFHNGQLGDQLQYFQQIQKGVVDLGLVNSAALENVIPAIGVVNLPYIFRDSGEYGAVMASPILRDALAEEAGQHNFWTLGFISSGFRSIYTINEVDGIDALKGMKLRTMTSPTYVEMLQRFGAVPTPLPLVELYSGLQQGIVDGAEGGLGGLYDSNLGEVAKFAVETRHTRLTDFIVTSTRFRDALSPEDLKIVEDEFAKVSISSIKFADDNDAKQLQLAVENKGVKVVPIDTAPFIEAVRPMHQAARDDAAKKPLIEAIFQIEGREF